MPVARVNATGLFYTSVGSGTPCLVMHGGLGPDQTHLRRWLDPLGDVLQLIYYDHRGNGRSERPPLDAVTHDDFSADADALRAHLGFDRIAVMGHSYGGCLALEYALRHPQRVSHLFLVGTTAAWDYMDELADELQRRGAGADVVSAVTNLPATDAELERNIKLQASLSFHPSNVHFADEIFDRTIWSAAANVRSRALATTFNVVDRLGEINAPTLILVGRDDFYCPPKQSERMSRAMPRAEMVVFEHSGHYPFVEEPEAFRRAVRGWLAGATSVSASPARKRA